MEVMMTSNNDQQDEKLDLGVGVNDATAVANATPSAADNGSLAGLDDPEARIAALEAELQQAKEERLRALADLENLRRRAARERQESAQFAIAHFARDILEVADNLQRALATAKTADRAADPALDALISGIEMTEKALHAILARHGITAIDTTNAPFDPNFHEAMFEIEDPTVPSGSVVQELERGYRIHDRILRAARVGVAKGGPRGARDDKDNGSQS